MPDQSPYTLHIRNMVCPRCIKVVTDELDKLALPVQEVKLGEAKLSQEPSQQELEKVKEVLAAEGFELLEDPKAEMVEKVKIAVINLLRSGKVEELHVNLSDYLSEQLGRDYNTLSALFSAAEGVTIARYMVLQKIEMAKELLDYNELSLSQIADKLGYSSVAHLSNQFKQITSLTPSAYKNSTSVARKPLDQLQ
ncbi:helix-turn-helix domain-containing protein [Pontibacter sp. BT310]|uniref:Helix-turn-helix domain-containing protein n=1 Tax=Pontibacter populi TaxID=890055 RepID=A0ABS6XD71_9BACT|nr:MULTISPECIES: helix-turn-helix domain-containing protein [Pontibacter]MBJ6119096.1 helix-turn-helix domain-containing protein [Pontibacter sp. BT310]MBR0571524.1 helix-turn-helix domain-containing protein [Microvirga sp. STS03]MBW3365950.1 helix-turn-helix domain-containing protein [Pontibacter populi]